MNDDYTAEQRAKFHAMCRDLSRQVEWAGGWLDEDEWKRILLAAKFKQRVVPDPFGHGFIVINNKRIRSSDKADLSELIGEVQAFGDEHGVRWSKEQ